MDVPLSSTHCPQNRRWRSLQLTDANRRAKDSQWAKVIHRSLIRLGMHAEKGRKRSYALSGSITYTERASVKKRKYWTVLRGTMYRVFRIRARRTHTCGRTRCDLGQAATGRFSKHSLGILASCQILSKTFPESDFYADHESCFENRKKCHFKLIKLIFQKFFRKNSIFL
jgi:hypothetical protein